MIIENLTLAEQEIHLNQSMDDTTTWYAYTDSQIWQRRLEKIGATLIHTMTDGLGKEYKLTADQVFLRKGKRATSDEQRAQASARMKSLRAKGKL